eukprot:g10444.t1
MLACQPTGPDSLGVARLLIFLLGGGLLFARSSQCQGSELFQTGYQIAINSATYLQSSATNAVGTAMDADYEVMSEELDPADGSNYTGAQTRTVDGYSCIPWGTNGTMAEAYTQEAYPTTDLKDNFCRNPYNAETATDDTKASTIWCFTSDSEVLWQECQPIGVLRPVCQNGYAVTDESIRTVLEPLGVEKYCAYVVWIIAVLYLLLILCFCSRIREAIAINKVAAIFVASNPVVIVVPLVQAVVAALWIGLWVFFASFLLSQAFNIACGQFIVAGAAAAWFFTPNSEKGKKGLCDINDVHDNSVHDVLMQIWLPGVVRQSLFWAFRYHFGSLAFGSFIIAVVEFIRYTLLYLQKQAEAQKNRVMVCILRITRCCLWCLEKFIKFINKSPGPHRPVSYGICGYVVSHLCMNVFGLAVDTFQQCFLLCEEEKDKIEGQHDFVPTQMLKILQLKPLEQQGSKDMDKE